MIDINDTVSGTIYNFLDNTTNLYFTEWGYTDLTSGEQFSNAIACAYPTSGQFCVLNRALFYVELLFVLLMRRHKYVAAAALASAVIYSSSAAVYAIMLAVVNRGDTDLIPLFHVLSGGLLFTAPLMFFHTSLSDLLDQTSITANGQVKRQYQPAAKAVLLAWSGLLSIGMTCASLSFIIDTDVVLAPLSCNWALRGGQDKYTKEKAAQLSGASPNHTLSTTLHSAIIFPYRQSTYNNNQCNSTCEALSGSAPIFRTMQQRAMDFSFNSISMHNRGVWRRLGNSVMAAMSVYLILLIIVAVHYQSCPPREIRDRIYAQVSRIASQSRFRLSLARFTAATIPLGIVLFLFQWPVLMVVNVVVDGYRLSSVPKSEPPSAVGQWSAWVGACLILAVVFINQLFSGSQNPETRIERDQWRMVREACDFLKDLPTWWKDPDNTTYQPVLAITPQTR